jgi:Spy/CpxP family protein refolding chaperone
MDDNRGSRKAVVLVFLVFVLGIALGALGTYVVTTRVLAARPQGVSRTPANTVAMFTRDLNLNPDQQKQIEAILSGTRARYAALHDKLDPEYEQIRQEGRERVREVLTPDQRPKFEDLLRRMDEDRRRRQAEGQGR